jgi:hypothetical protein
VAVVKCLQPSALDAAERFVWLSGRLLDRHRFAHLFRDGDRAPVLAALDPYQNPDGGFGNALEPDLRGPGSQPQPVEVALHVLDELGAMNDAMVAAACDYLVTITTPEGGVPFVLPSVRACPRAPWWETDDDPPASLNPTAAIAGLLHGGGVSHPWLEPATEYCWRRIDQLGETGTYEMCCVLGFLEHVPDRARAEAALRRVGPKLVEQGLVALEPGAGGEAFSPLAYAPGPGGIARRLFADGVVDAHLDALVDAQDEDGGWPVGWPVWTPATGPEWRAWLTIESIQCLRAYGRWG